MNSLHQLDDLFEDVDHVSPRKRWVIDTLAVVLILIVALASIDLLIMLLRFSIGLDPTTYSVLVALAHLIEHLIQGASV